MSLRYNIAVDDEGNSVITILSEGAEISITHEHPNYSRIASALVEGEDPAEWLSVGNMISSAEGFEYDEDEDVLRYGTEEVPNVVTNVLIRFSTEGRDLETVSKFMKRLEANPSWNSRQQLWRWIERQGLTLDTDGYIIGFKSVYRVDDDTFRSGTSGHAVVDGTTIDGYITQQVGSTVTMDRKNVADDPNTGCSYGLHVGTWHYASTFGGDTVLEVRVDPADVVSIPTDSSCQKMRCCRYDVVGIHDLHKGADLTHHEPEATWTPETFEEAMEPVIPTPFLAKLQGALQRRGSS